MSAAINANDKDDGVIGTESRNFGGQEFPEMAELSASDTATTIVVTGVTPGKPFTATWPSPSSAAGKTATVTANGQRPRSRPTAAVAVLALVPGHTLHRAVWMQHDGAVLPEDGAVDQRGT